MLQRALKITLSDGETLVINEDQVSTIRQGYGHKSGVMTAKVTMSNGEVLDVMNPPYPAWEADAYFNKGQ